jgi:hypothetical protein
MPFEFRAMKLGIFNEDEVLVVTLSEESHDERDARYLMVQRSDADDQQDRALGVSGPYIEVCDQAWGWYGHISAIRLLRNTIHVQMDDQASSQMRNDGLISVTFDLDNTNFDRLRSGLEAALRGLAGFSDEA